jgi:hypothetical protein
VVVWMLYSGDEGGSPGPELAVDRGCDARDGLEDGDGTSG